MSRYMQLDRGLWGVFVNITNKIGDFFDLKLIAGGLAITYSFLFGDLPYIIVGSLTMLVLIDMATGIAASKLSGVIIDSRRAFATAGKLIIYSMLISAAILTSRIIGVDLKIEAAVIFILAVTEFISILENCGNMGYAIPKRLLNKLRELRDDK